jgi:SAM-dependent methyltransferase
VALSGRESWAPLGRALLDYHRGDTGATIRVESDLWEPELTPVEDYYRPDAVPLPEIEWRALRLCRGRILDLGAGTGRHAVELQRLGRTVVAVDLLEEAVTIMGDRGVLDARLGDLDAAEGERFETILLMMHGIGLVGAVDRVAPFFEQLRTLLMPGGLVLCDSAGLGAVLPDAEESHRDSGSSRYFGEVQFRLTYRGQQGAAYPWLFVDAATLAREAERSGFCMSVVARGPRGAFLARFESL